MTATDLIPLAAAEFFVLLTFTPILPALLLVTGFLLLGF